MLAAALALAAPAYAPLFNGRDLTGWSSSPGGTWEAKNGMIVGTAPASIKEYAVLTTDKVYKDFTLKATFRVHKGDSGLYVRAVPIPGPVAVQGVQMEVDETRETGGLYETGGRGWIAKLDPAVHDQTGYAKGEWTEAIFGCYGPRFMVYINGVKVVDMVDEKNDRVGHIGLQLHANMEMHVEFKDIMIREHGTALRSALDVSEAGRVKRVGG